MKTKKKSGAGANDQTVYKENKTTKNLKVSENAKLKSAPQDAANSYQTEQSHLPQTTPIESTSSKTNKRILVGALRIGGYWLVGGSLALAGAIKIADTESFLLTLEAIGILPENLNYLVAYCLPLVELLVGYMLLFQTMRKAGLLIACGLYLSFSIWLLIANIYSLPISCGCFGKWDPLESNPIGSLIRAMALLGICVWLWAKPNKS